MSRDDFIDYLTQEYEVDEFEICDGEYEYLISELDVKVRFNDDETFNIYRDICYPDKDCEENFETIFKGCIQNALENALEREFNEAPLSEWECSYGCPFDDILVGYWNKSIDMNFLNLFVATVITAEKDCDYSSVNAKLFDRLFEVLKDDGFIRQKNMIVNDAKTMIFNTIDKKCDRQFFDISKCMKIEKTYEGIKWLFAKSSQSIELSCVDIELYKIFYETYTKTNCDDEIEMYSDFQKILYIGNSYFFALISLNAKQQNYEDIEYNYLSSRLQQLRYFNPNITIKGLHFEHLKPKEFEDLCYEILLKLEFVEVHPVGRVNAPDGGKDIIAEEHFKTLLGVEKREWLWQCKHSKTSLGRKDVAEIDDLLEENGANCYGLFCSNDLTPDAISRLEAKRKKIDGKLQYYGKKEMESLIQKFDDLIRKYRLL